MRSHCQMKRGLVSVVLDWRCKFHVIYREDAAVLPFGRWEFNFLKLVDVEIIDGSSPSHPSLISKAQDRTFHLQEDKQDTDNSLNCTGSHCRVITIIIKTLTLQWSHPILSCTSFMVESDHLTLFKAINQTNRKTLNSINTPNSTFNPQHRKFKQTIQLLQR